MCWSLFKIWVLGVLEVCSLKLRLYIDMIEVLIILKEFLNVFKLVDRVIIKYV